MSQSTTLRLLPRWPLVASLFGVLALSGCDDDDEGIKIDHFSEARADTLCGLVFQCNCHSATTGTLDHCEQYVRDVSDELLAQTREAGLSYDAHCAEEALHEADRLACAIVPPEATECTRPCRTFYGPVPQGGSCSAWLGYSNCSQGLVCGPGNVCIDPCFEVERPVVGESCWAGVCEVGAFCNETNAAAPVCAWLPKDNAPCTATRECAEGYYCTNIDGIDRCAPYLDVGGDCTEAPCRESLVCSFDGLTATCVVRPPAGQACVNGICDEQAECDPFTEMCVPREAAVCGVWEGLPEIPDDDTSETATSGG